MALQFSAVNRTGVYLHDGQPESDTDHTVMLGWVACSFAAKHYPELDQGLIAQFALVHDTPEIYAGEFKELINLYKRTAFRVIKDVRIKQIGT